MLVVIEVRAFFAQLANSSDVGDESDIDIALSSVSPSRSIFIFTSFDDGGGLEDDDEEELDDDAFVSLLAAFLFGGIFLWI